MENKTQTPRTDAAEFQCDVCSGESWASVRADFARTLELELNEARERLAKAGVEPFVGDYFLGQPTITGILRSQLTTAQQERDDAIESTVRSNQLDVWRVAITLAHNICVQESDRINNEDGSLESVNALSECAKRIRGWLEPEDSQLVEMLNEAGVGSHTPQKEKKV
jgi:hypothetical protein